MRYGRVLGDSWKAMWRSWALWGFLATWMGATVLVIGASFLGLVALFATLVNDPESLAVVVAVPIAIVALGLFMFPLFLVIHAGAIHLSNEALEGRPVRYADAWRAGFRRLGALAGFEIVSYLILMAVMAVVFVLVAVVFGGIVSGLDDSGAVFGAAMSGICCGYAVFLAAAFFAAILISAFEAVGARAAVLSGRGGIAAFSDAWRAVTKSFKAMFVMGLIMVGVGWVYSFVSSMMLTPLQFVYMPELMSLSDPTSMTPYDPTQFMGMFGTYYVLYGGGTLLLTFPLMVYRYFAWTAFYRQLTGIAPAEAFAPKPAQAGYVPEPPPAYEPVAIPAPPAPPAPQAPPLVPEPPAPPVPPPPPHDGGESGI